jgi:Leucine-rich repeat (LRR) protein
MVLLIAGSSATGPAAWIADRGGSVDTEAGRIVGVHLGFDWVTDSDIESLALINDLRTLDLSLSLVTDTGIERLKPLSRIVDLNLYAVEHITDVAIAYIRGWKKLERLNLRGTDITDTSLQYIAGLTSLKSLDVSCTQVTNKGIDYLVSLQNLENLAIGGNKITGSALSILKTLPKLRNLSLTGIQKRNSGLWSVSLTDFDIEKIAGLKTLETLDLGGAKLTDLGVVKLKTLSGLRSLNLDRTEVSNRGLSELSGFSMLEKLSLWKAKRVDDKVAATIAALKGLVTLDISETQVTDVGLKQIGTVPKLRHLYARGTSITSAGVEAFRRANPNCQVSWN